MVNLAIDDDTYTALQGEAAASGLSVDAWLKRSLGRRSQVDDSPLDLTIAERLAHFNELTQFLERTDFGSGGVLDDSREMIYGVRNN